MKTKKATKLPRAEDRRYRLVGSHAEGYFVHCVETTADAEVVDEHGEPLREFGEVQAWLRENFPGCDVRMS